MVAVLAALLVPAAVAPAQPAAPPGFDPAIGRALGAYLNHPQENRGALFEIARDGTADLPPAFLLALADALLRSGQRRAAGDVLREALTRNPSVEVAGWARFGLGWLALAGGDLTEARRHYEDVVAGGWQSLTASTVLGLISASTGRSPDAITLLEQIAIAGEAPSSLRMVARLGAAYARYWGRDYAGASAAFEAAAAESTDERLTDDARYGAAWALYRSGQTDGAIEALRVLAGDRPDDAGRVGGALVNLEPRAVLRTSLRRYRGAPVGLPHEQLVSLLDLDGAALAQAALRQIDRGGAGEPAAEQRAAPAHAAGMAREMAETDRGAPAPARIDGKPSIDPGTPRAAPDGHRAWLALLAIAIAVALAATTLARAGRRRPSPRFPRPT